MPDPQRTGPLTETGSQSAAKTTTASVVDDTDSDAILETSAVYRTSPVKRARRSRAEIEELGRAILDVCALDHPLSVRGVFYRVMSAGAVAKTEKSYAAVQREVLKLRRSGALPYEWIADGARWHVKDPSWSTVEDALEDAAASYRRAVAADQADEDQRQP